MLTTRNTAMSFIFMQIKFKIKFQIPKNNPYWKFQEILDIGQDKGNLYSGPILYTTGK